MISTISCLKPYKISLLPEEFLNEDNVGPRDCLFDTNRLISTTLVFYSVPWNIAPQ